MKYGFGIDVGGTTIKMGLLDDTGTLIEKREIPTHVQDNGEAILPEIAAEISAWIRKKNLETSEILGIGIGVPGPVDENGRINRCVNLNWGVFNLHETLGRMTGLRVRAGNDANVAALGEEWKGGGEGCRSAVFITLGTGVGGGVVINGKVVSGAHGAGGEIGHITVPDPEKAPCSCGKCGCLEQYASANGIVRVTKKRLLEMDTESLLRGASTITCKDVFDAARQQDAFAVETLELIFDYLGEAIASICCVCDPQYVIFGGGVSRQGEFLLEGVKRHFEKYAFHACKSVQFRQATLGNDAGMYGAFRLLLLN